MLSDIEKEKLGALVSDEITLNALRKVLLATIYSNGTLKADVAPDPLKNGALSLAMMTLSGRAIISDQELGADIRGLAAGVNLLEVGLKELENYKAKPVDLPDAGENPGK